MSTGPDSAPSAVKPERNWLPIAAAAAIVIAVAALVILNLELRHNRTQQAAAIVTPINAPLDPYAPNLQIYGVKMSESGNLAGGKLTYLDGHIANTGARTVTAITVQSLFRSYAHEVAQNDTQPMKFIRIHDPYIDVESISAAPLKPGEEHEFRLIFDAVSPDWENGLYPELRIVHVETR